MLLPYRVKVSDTKVTHFTPISALRKCFYRSHLRKPVSMKQTKQQKVRGSKFMFKMSTIHANTCIQTTMPLRNRWWFRWQCPVLVLRSCTSALHAAVLFYWLLLLLFLEPGDKVNGDYYRNTVLLNMLLLNIRSVFGDYYVFSARWGTSTSCTWHCHHAAKRDARVYPSRDVAT